MVSAGGEKISFIFKLGWGRFGCPETNDDLHLLSKEERERVNRAIAHGTAMNRKNEAVLQPIDEGLLRADGKFLYPIQDGIPIMLIDEAIDMRTVP
jgi:uncharacterized protein YbaR (Trm112 family)